MPDTAGVTHHLVLDGQGYMLHQTPGGLAYRRSETPYFVPRRAGAVGRDALTRPGQDNGGFTQAVQTQFGQGGYARAHGIDARAGDGLRIATKLAAVTGLDIPVLTWAEFNATVYAGSTDGAALKVYKYTIATSTFAELTGSATDAVRLVAFAEHLWLAQSSGFIAEVDTADVATLASGSNSADIVDIGRSGTRLVGVVGSGATRAVRWCDLTGDVPSTINFNTADENGDPQEPITQVAALGEAVYLAKCDGLYRVTFKSSSSVTLTLVADHRARRDADNFRALVAWRDALYYSVRDRLYRFDGSRETDVSPPASVCGPSGAGVTRYVVKAVAAGSGWLWALTESDEATPAVHLWAYNGDRWEQLVRVVSASDAQAGSLHYSPTANRLFINVFGVGVWSTSQMDVSATSDLPSASFETSGNFCFLPPLDGDLPEVDKRFHSIVLRGSGFSASTSVVVWYWDGASWVSLGSLTSGLGGELPFATPVTGKHLLLRLDLRSNGTQTPIVHEVGVAYDVLPGPARVIEFDAVLAPNLRLLDGSVEADTPTTLLAHLDAARAAGAVVTLHDPVTSATGAGGLTVCVTEVGLKTLLSVPNGSGQYGWLVGVRCEMV